MIRLLGAAVLLVGVAAGARAQDATGGLDLSKGGPIEVTSRDGIEWRQGDQVVVARGDARAVRGDVSVMADQLIAHYRRKAGAGTTPVSAGSVSTAPVSAGSVMGGGGDTGANEIYRLEAEGHVKIFNKSDIAVGDRAVYDIDQAVLVMTGKDLSLTTPSQVMTARDTLEWWSQKHMAVGRGLATVTTADGKRLSADVLVGYTAPSGPAAKPAAAKSGNEAAMAGKLQRAEAFGHVEVRTATETVTGDRGVYVSEGDIARVVGHVHITRGMNQLNGDEALVNMKTGISTLVRDPGTRVQGLIVPNEAGGAAGAPDAKPAPAAKAGKR